VSEARIDRLRARLEPLAAAAFLVTAPVNVRYLTGFESSNAAVLVTPDDTLLFTDGRYIEAARAVTGVDARLADRNLSFELGEHLAELTSGPVAIEGNRLTVADQGRIAKSGLELTCVEREVERLRATKDPDELDAIRAAAAILSEAFERLAATTLVGATEREVAWRLERTMREDLGADALAFDIIVGAGPNGALPHHHPGDRPIGTGELVVVDAGCMVGGYCSDCTRTFATGAVPPDLVAAYEACRDVQASMLDLVRAGAEARAIDDAHRAAVEAAGYEVLHGLGHGVGLEIHEEPRLHKVSTDTLAAGHVVTVEPGVYLAGRAGVRIEDLVVVTDDGAEILTPVTKELVTVA
jgi:Xaa-Pro aminopeptidase